MISDGLQKNAKLGQVWTPNDLANKMARMALSARKNIWKILDPACGPATFSMALHTEGSSGLHLDSLDIDERMVRYTAVQNKALGFSGSARTQDYLADTTLEGKYDLVIMNPPYIRQEQISSGNKNSYCKYLERHLACRIDRRSNLFALFLLKGLLDLRVDGILCAIVYDAVTQSGYGGKTLAIIERHAQYLSSDNVRTPFDGVLVDAQILLYRKYGSRKPKAQSKVSKPEAGCVSLDALLKSRRGTALPVRKGYLAEKADPFFTASVPFFIKQGKLKGLVIQPDARAYLEDSFADNNYDFVVWLKNRAKLNGIKLSRLSIPPVNGRILFNYYIRNAPRHLWNGSRIAVSDNFYVSHTKDFFPAEVAWLLLNSDQYLERLVAAARNQGNGLKKLQLYEYNQVMVPDWRLIDEPHLETLRKHATNLIDSNPDIESAKRIATCAAKEFLNA